MSKYSTIIGIIPIITLYFDNMDFKMLIKNCANTLDSNSIPYFIPGKLSTTLILMSGKLVTT